MEKYHIDRPFSLCSLAALQISKQLWVQPDVKQLLMQCIRENKRWSKHESTELQNALRMEISRKIDEFLLPVSVKKDLRLVVESMGMRIRNWALEQYGEDLEPYIEYIRWTSYGFIDASATVRSMYFSNILPENANTWERLCDHCLEDCITDFWPKLSEFESKPIEYHYTCMSLYWCCRMQNSLEEKHGDLTEMMAFYKEEYSLAENLFMDSLAGSRSYPQVKYFWRLLNHDQRKRTIIDGTQELIDSLQFPQRTLDGFHEGNDEGLHISIFLLRELYFYEQSHLWIVLLKSKYVLVQLLKWPCLDVFMEALKESLKHHELIDSSRILIEILRYMDALFSTAGADVQHRKLFYNVWEMFLNDSKVDLDSFDVLIPLWSMRETAWLKNIINDVRLVALRQSHINCLMQCFAHWPYLSNAAFFEEFIAEVLVSDEEREKFRTDVTHERN